MSAICGVYDAVHVGEVTNVTIFFLRLRQFSTDTSLRAACLLAVAIAMLSAENVGAQIVKQEVRDSTDGQHGASGVSILTGVIRDERGEPRPGIRVTLLGTTVAATTNRVGRFRMPAVPVRRYTMRVSRIGYIPQDIADVDVVRGDSTIRDVMLTSSAVPLSQVNITPGSFTLLDQSSASTMSTSRDAMLTSPQLGEDVFRSLSRLPGLSGSDYSAKIRIRNGGADEQLVTLDGLELVEPFHLKDFDGALSILDGESIGNVAVTTGGFSAASGNRLTGLLNMQSAPANDGRRSTALGLSLSNIRARSQGTFSNGRGSWLASARRGYLELLFKFLGETNPPDPRYSDAFGKVEYILSPTHTVRVEALLATDRLTLTDSTGASIQSKYGNRYLWATSDVRFGDRAHVTTLASLSELEWARDGLDIERLLSKSYERVRLTDRRSLTAMALKQDWTIDLTPTFSVLAGSELRFERAAYRYSRAQRIRAVVARNVVVVDSSIIAAALAPRGVRSSGYVSVRAKTGRSVASELGARVDSHQWTSQTTATPRANVAWNATPTITIRGAWGLYAQAHTLQDLSIVDGDTAYSRAEQAQHRIMSIELQPAQGWTARAEVYQRVLTSPRARYFNVDGSLDALPETAADRVRFAPSRGDVRGLELLAQYDAGAHWRAGASLAISRAVAVTSGRTAPRPYDEPVSATGDLAYRGTRGWTVALAFTAHSGWPSAPPNFAIDTLGVGRYAVVRLPSTPYFGSRLATYHRLDLRATQRVTTSRGVFNVFVDVFNTLNHQNQRGSTYSASLLSPSTVRVTANRQDFLGILPSLGMGWEFR